MRSTELSTLACAMALAEVVGVDEADDASGADGGVAECLSEEALADAGGADEQDMFVLGPGTPERRRRPAGGGPR